MSTADVLTRHGFCFDPSAQYRITPAMNSSRALSSPNLSRSLLHDPLLGCDPPRSQSSGPPFSTCDAALLKQRALLVRDRHALQPQRQRALRNRNLRPYLSIGATFLPHLARDSPQVVLRARSLLPLRAGDACRPIRDRSRRLHCEHLRDLRCRESQPPELACFLFLSLVSITGHAPKVHVTSDNNVSRLRAHHTGKHPNKEG